MADLTPEIACETLRAVGLFCSPDEVQILAREERWAVVLPAERIARFPASESGSRRLAIERCVLRLIADRCSFRVPRTLSCRSPASRSAKWFPATAIRGASSSAASKIANWHNESAGRSAASPRSSIRRSAKRG